MSADVYQDVTDRIVSDLGNGVRSWLKPWNAEHMAGRATRLRRWNGKPCMVAPREVTVIDDDFKCPDHALRSHRM